MTIVLVRRSGRHRQGVEVLQALDEQFEDAKTTAWFDNYIHDTHVPYTFKGKSAFGGSRASLLTVPRTVFGTLSEVLILFLLGTVLALTP